MIHFTILGIPVRVEPWFWLTMALIGESFSAAEGSLFGPFLMYLITVSIFWAVFNCFPIYPMDGGQMLAAILGPQRQKLVHIIGLVCAVTLGLVGYFMLQSFFLPIFMALFAWQNWQALQAHPSK